MSVPELYKGNDAPLARPVPVVTATSDRFDMRSLITIFRRRLLLFSLVVANCVALALLLTLVWPKTYTATANVVLTNAADVTPSPDQAPPSGDNTERTETNWRIIQSRGVAETVFRNLRLDQDQAFMGKIASGGFIRSLVGRVVKLPPLDPAVVHDQAISQMLSSLTVSRLGNSYVLEIDYSDGDAKRAAAIANGFAGQLAAYQVMLKQRDNNRAIAVLKARADQLRDDAQRDYAAVQQYRIRRNLLSSNLATLTEQELATYSQQVATARAEAAQANARLSAARSQLAQGKLDVGAAQNAPVVQSLRSQRAAISARVADLSGRYLDDYPELQEARRQLADIDAQIAVEVKRSLSGLEAEAQASGQRLASLEGSQNVTRGTLADNNAALVPLSDLQRKAEASQSLYETYLDRYKQAVTRAGAEKSDSQTISRANVPQTPSSPLLVLNLALGLVVGVLGGATAALAAETNYSGLTTGSDIEQRLGIRSLGAVPLSRSVDPGVADPLVAIRTMPSGALAEAARGVLASIRQAANGRRQIIAVTSALPGEGKTTVSICLARIAAADGMRVVLIDADTIRHGVSKRLAVDATKPGLRDIVIADAEIDAVLQPDSEVPALALLPITAPFGAHERLMGQGKLHRLLAKLRERFDLIIIDCAPLLPIADGREVAGQADNVVMVARWRVSTDTAMRAAMKLLPLRQIDDIGGVLNAVDMRKGTRFGGDDPTFLYKQYRSYYGTR